MKYLSLFSGIVGFELGIQQAYEQICSTKKSGARIQGVGDKEGLGGQRPDICTDGLSCIGFSEIDKYAVQIYQSHFPEHKNYGDITKINASELPDFELLVGGFPCQSFSIAGKRGGFEDTRGTLFFEIARILRAKQPRLFLLENVKGLLSHDNGNTFKTIVSTLDELGYDLQWQVLNSKNHGVPQNRERVFIVGHLRGTSRPEVFPIGETHKASDGEHKTQNLQVGEQKGSDETNKDYAICLTAQQRDGGRGVNHIEVKSVNCQYVHGDSIRQLNQPSHSNDRVYDTNGISPTLNTMQGGLRQPFISEEPKIRRLTPTECERLQGFPDGWTAVANTSDTQRYKTLGNAVTVNVIEAIMKKLLLPIPTTK